MTARSPTMVTVHDTRFVQYPSSGDCRTVKTIVALHDTGPPRWPSGKASTSRAEGPGFESRLSREFFGVESYQ